MFGDLRHGLRLVVNAKRWTAVVVLLLALGIGADTALFSSVNGLLLKQTPQANRYDQVRTHALYEELLARLAAVPGVRGAALSQPALLSGSVSSSGIYVQGRAYAPGTRDDIHRVIVSPGFFETMGIPLAAGRGFTGHDRNGAPKVVVIDEAAARRHFPNQDPLGQRLGSTLESSTDFQIVGVLRDVKYDSVREAAPPTMYVPSLQHPIGTAVFEVRTASDPAPVIASVREAVKQIDPNLPLMNVSTQVEQVEQRVLQEKIFAYAYAIFAGLALVLAAIGLFGLMSYNVSRRTNEIGIRMALGAERLDVLRLVLRESMLLVAAGVCIGVAVALGAGRFVASLLFGLTATDTTTIIVAIAVMVLVAAIAGYLPARRAARVDPVVALRYE
jgi:predicted permease